MLRILSIAVPMLMFCFSLEADQQDLLSDSKTAIDNAGAIVLPEIRYDDSVSKNALEDSRSVISGIETHQPVTPNLPNPDLFNIPDTGSIDIGNLAQQGQNLMGKVEEEKDRYESQILVFISASMPDITVKRYLDQTREIDAAVVMRGLVNDSFIDTQKYLARVLEKDETSKQPTILIDPTLFSRFGIQQVPITVVTEEQIQACKKDFCPTPVHHTVSGDVSLAWALGLISRQIDSASLKEKLRPLIKSVESL